MLERLINFKIITYLKRLYDETTFFSSFGIVNLNKYSLNFDQNSEQRNIPYYKFTLVSFFLLNHKFYRSLVNYFIEE